MYIQMRTNVPKDALLVEKATSFTQENGTIKYKDPGYPTLLCTLGVNTLAKPSLI